MQRDEPWTDMSDVDADGMAARYARLNDRIQEQAQKGKTRSYELLELRAGNRVLEVGAGTGEDAVTLSRMVAPDGQVVALDKSADLLAEARRRIGDASAAVELRQGDVNALDFADGSFDACRAERLFQHLDDPQRALGEMVRVTSSGGHIVAIDADYDTMSIDASDRAVTRAVVHRRADLAPHGWIGRQLPRLFGEAGLVDVAVEAVSFVCPDHALALEIFELAAIAESAAADGEVTPDQVAAWIAELAQRGRDGRFFLASTGYMVAGRKP